MPAIDFTRRGAEGFLGLDPAVQPEARKAIGRPGRVPKAYGEPLGNKAGIALYGYASIRAGCGVRLVCRADPITNDRVILVVERDRFLASESAEARIRHLAEATTEELQSLRPVLERAGHGDPSNSCPWPVQFPVPGLQ